MPLGKLYPTFVAVYVGPVLHRAVHPCESIVNTLQPCFLAGFVGHFLRQY
jgi:hypothetical protein